MICSFDGWFPNIDHTVVQFSHFINGEENMGEATDSCVKPARGPIVEVKMESTTPEKVKEVKMEIARVGKKAPDFEANAYVAGGFKPIRLSDHFGKWIVLCFYPGDFTFV